MRRIFQTVVVLLCLPFVLPAQDKIDFYWYRKALTHKSQGNFSNAVKDFSTFLWKYPDEYPDAYYYRGYSYLYMKDFDNAIKDFQTLTDLDKTNVDGPFSAGRAYYQKGEYMEAIHSFRKALQVDPYHVQSMNDMGMAHCGLKEFDAALNIFYRAIAIDSTFAMLRNNAGAARYFNQDIEEPSTLDLRVAHDWFSQAVILDPKLFLAWRNRAAMSYFLEDYEDALFSLKKAKDLNGKDAMTWFYHGVVFSDRGDHGRAYSYFKKAIDMQEDFYFGYEEMAHIQKKEGNVDGAVQLYKKAQEVVSRDNDRYKGLMDYRIASVYAKDKDPVKAMNFLKKAFRKGVFSDKRVYQDFISSKDFKNIKSHKPLKSFYGKVRGVRKDNKFKSMDLGWFRMRKQNI